MPQKAKAPDKQMDGKQELAATSQMDGKQEQQMGEQQMGDDKKGDAEMGEQQMGEQQMGEQELGEQQMDGKQELVATSQMDDLEGDEGPNADWVGTVITDVGREDEYELQWARLGNFREVHTCPRHMECLGRPASGGEIDLSTPLRTRLLIDDQRVIAYDFLCENNGSQAVASTFLLIDDRDEIVLSLIGLARKGCGINLNDDDGESWVVLPNGLRAPVIEYKGSYYIRIRVGVASARRE